MTADVSILIPAYAAEAFIERTLQHARAQTHEAISILVAIDQCEDRTEEIARAHAAADPRVTVFKQRERVGWAGNVNFLLDRADTPFHFIYFHDDIIAPAYVETLLAALRAAPDAASVHCDMGHFGGSDAVSLGRPYDGDAVRRLLIFMLAPYRGSPLRSLMRADAVRGLRLPQFDAAAIWANEPFLIRLIGAGPALHVPQALYHRWDKRGGGLTDSWKALPRAHIFAGHKANIALAMNVIDAAARNEAERAMLVFACFLYALPIVRALEQDGFVFARPEELHPRFAALAPPPSFDVYGGDIAAWAAQRWADAEADLAARGA
ncbi:MAG TPA: glycosyltransferase family 2 protein [Vitreimonas sp.]|uniref:glycosyltransferase family 2 protein n=1 Tax=Vitreimonas sp. TaxID=3069702 RepID=UPI002D532C35|nr:glycosyltransferase family 2 protein [Vitreimonas sp.]HYD87792.1 glycosyltransferase family 2 protein [Vitreimonas sp.]